MQVELRGSAPAYLSAGILKHLDDELGHMDPRVTTHRGRVVLELSVISDAHEAASTYARERVAASLISAGLLAWEAIVVEVQADHGSAEG